MPYVESQAEEGDDDNADLCTHAMATYDKDEYPRPRVLPRRKLNAVVFPEARKDILAGLERYVTFVPIRTRYIPDATRIFGSRFSELKRRSSRRNHDW